ncbi:UPF0481 protein At3g47200-like [Macadamia integrifolia]|uniref:UPF0481 protein At3g47200-like n=1 Tax=Macadamia integrifolia TaxID=60698 RepID=UPI001C4F0772|nr:UPF0481 protein At3g47200-like [Macadamia integrifolia]
MAPSKPNDVAIDMPRGDQLEEHQEVKPKPEPCEELKTIFKYKAQTGTGTSSGAEARPLIQKVPRILRGNENNKYNFDPRLVSIGPYHYGDPKLELGQTLKIKLVQQFSSYVQNNKSQKWKSLEAYFKSGHFDKVASDTREFYANDSKLDAFNEEAFKCLMFLDGCFMVYFIHCIVNKCDNVRIKNDHKAIITMDLFLLENQLPYKVLKALRAEFMPLVDNAVDDDTKFIKMQTGAKGSEPRVFKVYECIANCLCRKPKKTTTKSGGSSSNEPFHLLDFLRNEFLGTETSDETQQKTEGNTEWQSFRSVEELKSAGINCMTSGSSSVKEIKFKPFESLMHIRLYLPAIVIDETFKTKWLNLAAYEACPDFFNDGEISSFICFMDSLIDRPEDVKELRERGVLQNFLGSDQHVAELFNELASDLTPNPNEYRQVKHDIQKHFNKTWVVWFTEVLHTYFSSPWSSFAFLAAVLALVLTAVQTHYAIHPKK